MEREITTYKLFVNNDERAIDVAKYLKSELDSNGFIENEESFQLAIAVGGDGSFLRMVRSCGFKPDVYFVGVNAGTLGFRQEVEPNKIPDFIKKLKENSYTIENMGIQETVVECVDKCEKFYSLNEVVIRDKNLSTSVLSVDIDNNFLEDFAGDGLLIATSSGSTAYNLGLGGSIVYSKLHTLQVTPVAPFNSKVYNMLRNSIIIPENLDIKITPKNSKNNLLLSIDGENKVFDNVKQISTTVSDTKIKVMRLFEYSDIKVIRKKFLY